MTPAAEDTFDPQVGYRVGKHVVLRREAFGALAYDLITTRLLVLRDQALVTVLNEMEQYPNVGAAVAALAPGREKPMLAALAGLEKGGLIDVA